jgi:transcription antitermination protein NusB
VSRHSAREAVFKALFQADITGESPETALAQELIQEGLPQEADKKFAAELAAGVTAHRRRLDEVLVPHLKKWHLRRLPVTDRAILRLAIYELLYAGEVPPLAVINEALELAKKYGDAKSAPFINGVLDNILKGIREESRE